MSVTPQTVVVNVPADMTREAFVASLVGTPSEAEAASAYDAITAEHVSPAFCRTIFRHESSDGTKGVCHDYDTHSPGNTRTSSTGAGEDITVPGKGTYRKYPNWTEGWRDLAHRLVDSRFPYAQRGLVTIGQILPTFAPSSDGNDPNGYIDAVVANMNQLVVEEDTVSGRDPQATWLPSSNYNQGRNGKSIEMIVEHITQGTDSRSWLQGANGGSTNRDSSSTYLIQRAAELYQLVDENDTPWADGNLDWNQRSITIEHEGKSGEPLTAKQIQGSAELHARIAQRHGWSQLTRGQNVFGHADVPDPNNPSQGGGIDHHVNCPGPAFPWDEILNGANAILQGGQPAQPDNRYFPETQHYISHGFLRFWEENGGLTIFGFPLSEEFTGPDGFTIQYFEKGQRFEYQPQIASNQWGVVLGNTGSEHLDDMKARFPEAFAPVAGPQS